MGNPDIEEVTPPPSEGGEPRLEQLSEAPEKLSLRGPFSAMGATLDALLTQPESWGCLIASLVLALFLYLVTWFLNDAWYFAATKWAEVSGQAVTVTVTVSPAPSPSFTAPISSTVPLTPTSPPATLVTATIPLTPELSLPTPGDVSTPSPSSPLVLVCGGMGCGALIVLPIVLIVSRHVRRPSL